MNSEKRPFLKLLWLVATLLAAACMVEEHGLAPYPPDAPVDGRPSDSSAVPDLRDSVGDGTSGAEGSVDGQAGSGGSSGVGGQGGGAGTGGGAGGTGGTISDGGVDASLSDAPGSRGDSADTDGGGGNDASADAGALDGISGVDGDVRDGDDADARSNDVSTDPSVDTAPPIPDAPPDIAPPMDAVSEPYCGDGHRDPGEECDLGPANLPNPYGPGLCSTQCTNAPYCGDGRRDPQEQCDQGSGNQPNPYGQGLCSTQCTNAPYCGDGNKDPQEQCDLGSGNQPNPYGQGTCSTQCKNGGYCGDGATNGPEICDNGGTGSTDLGACNPVCTGYYEKKIIRQTIGFYSTNLGGPSGADAICQAEFGSAWKAFLVGGARRATVTPLAGDGQQDWVIQKYTHYYNLRDEFIWRTDDVSLLGVRNGARLTIYANPFDATGSYPWTGWENDWTTVAEDPSISRGTCLGWTSTDPAWRASFCLPDLTHGATELCGGSSFILCVQQ